MAQQVIVSLLDDLDNTEDGSVTTIEFGLDGVTYEIDLSEANAEKLRDLLGDYLDAARRISGRHRGGGHRGGGKGGSRGSNGKVKGLDANPAAIREWAADNDITLADRGRIPKHIEEQYREAMGGQVA